MVMMSAQTSHWCDPPVSLSLSLPLIEAKRNKSDGIRVGRAREYSLSLKTKNQWEQSKNGALEWPVFKYRPNGVT